MSTKITVDMKPVNVILSRLGVDADGDVQRFLTAEIHRRMTRYMPKQSGNLSTKLKIIRSPTEIEVLGPYARYQYYGKAMEGAAPRVVTDRDLQYDTSKHPLAGPFWDRRLMTAEGDAIASDVEEYVGRK